MNLILKLFSFKTISDTCFSWLFRITVLDDYFGCLFQMPISDDFSRWLSDASEWPFQVTVPDEYFGCLFQMTFQMTVRNSTTDSYFSDQSVFPRSISTYYTFLFQPIIRRLIGATTDSFLNDGFLLQNYGSDPPDIYMGWTFQFALFKPWGNFSSVCRDEIFAYNHNSVFILLSLSVGTEILSSRFNGLKFHHGLKLSTINPPLRWRFLQK